MTDDDLDRLVAELSDDTLAAVATRDVCPPLEESGTAAATNHRLGRLLCFRRPEAVLNRLVAEVARLRAEAAQGDMFGGDA